VGDVLWFLPRPTIVLLSPIRNFRHAFVVHLTLAGFENKREVCGGRLAQGGHRRTDAWRCRACTTWGGRGCAGRARGAPIRRAAGISTQATARKTEPAVHSLLEEIRSNNPVRRQPTLRMTDKPERFNIVFADLLDDRLDDVLQVLV